MKSAGIIGGLGPDTTAAFYMDIVRGCKSSGMTARPGLFITNVPVPLDVEQEFILRNRGIENYLPYLLDQAVILEKAGSDFIVMPCNSLHVFIDEIRESVHIPVLSIVEETVSFLISKGVSRVGVISTMSTSQSGIYDQAMAAASMEFYKPGNSQQVEINGIISRLLKGQKEDDDFTALVKIIDAFGAYDLHDLVLACTDLQILDPVHPTIRIHDTMKILADATVVRLMDH